jgi:hypothetical protein
METSDNIETKIVCVGCTERTLLVSFFIVLFVYTVWFQYQSITDHVKNSSYDSTAKWETCQISEQDRLLVHI